MADNNLILDVVAGIRLGTAGVVNQKQAINSIQQDIERTLRSVTVDAGKINISADVRLDKRTLDRSRKFLQTELQSITKAIDQKKIGETLRTSMFDDLFKDKLGRDLKGAAQARQALVDRLQPLGIADLEGLKDARLAQTQMVEALSKYNKLGKKTQELYNGFQKGGIIPDKDLERVKQAAEAVEQLLTARERVRKAAAGGRAVTEPVFGPEYVLGDKILRDRTGSRAALTPALDVQGAAVPIGGRQQLKVVQDAINKENQAAIDQAEKLLQKRGQIEDAALIADRKRTEAKQKEIQDQGKMEDAALIEDKRRADAQARALRAAQARARPRVAAGQIADEALKSGFALYSDKDLARAQSLLSTEAKRIDLLKRNGETVYGFEERRLAAIRQAEPILLEEIKLRQKIQREAEQASRKAAADKKRQADAAIKQSKEELDALRAATARKAEIAELGRRVTLQPGKGGFTSTSEIKSARELLKLEEDRLRAMEKLNSSASRRQRLQQIDTINAGLTRQLKIIQKIAATQDQARAGLGGFGGGGGSSITGTSREFEELAKKSGNLRDRLGETGLLLRQFFRYALGYGALYKALGAISALTKGVVELDKELKSIQAISASTEEQMLSIEGAIKTVATTTKFSVSEIAKAARVLAQAGVEPEQINTVLSSVAQFAAGTETSLETAADVASTMRNVFTELEDIQIADKLTKAINISKLTGEDLRVVLSISAQIAQSFELSGDQYLAAVTTLRNAGLKASTVATGLRQGLLEIFSPDSKSIKAFVQRYEEIGENLNQTEIRQKFAGFQATANPLLTALKELNRLGFTGEGKQTFARAFDIRAENAISALINNLDKLEEAEARISLGGAAAEASATQMESLSNTLDNLGAAMTVLAADITEGPIQALQELAKEATNVVNALDQMDLDLKARGGEGIGGIFGTALAGGFAGGALIGGQPLRRVIGATAGAAAGAYGGFNTLQEAQEGAVTTEDAEASLDIINTLLTAAGFLSLTKGIGAGKVAGVKDKLGELRGISGGFSGLLTETLFVAGAALSSVGGFFGVIKAGFSKLWSAVKLFGRTNPIGIALTALYAGYEAWQAFSEDATDQRQEFEDIQKKLKAQKQKTTRDRQALEKTTQAFEQYQFTDKEAGVEAQTGTTAALLQEEGNRLDRARASLRKSFFQDIGNLDDLINAFEELAKGPASESGSGARRAALQKLQQDTGAQLENITAEQDQLLASMISDYLEAFRKIRSVGKDLTERYSRLKTRDLVEGSEEEVFVQEFERIQSENPRLYAALRGDTAALAEIGGITGLFDSLKKMYSAIYIRGQKVIDAGLEKGVDNLANEFSTEVDGIVQGVKTGQLTFTDAQAKLRAEIDKLMSTGRTSFKALQEAYAVVERKMAELQGLASEAYATLRAAASPGQAPRELSPLEGGFDSPASYAPAQTVPEAGATVTASEEGKRLLEETKKEIKAGSDRQQQVGEEANRLAEERANALYENIQQNAEMLRNDQIIITALGAGGTEAFRLYNAALSADREEFDELVRARNRDLSEQTNIDVRTLTASAEKVLKQVEQSRSRQIKIDDEKRQVTELQRFAPDPAIALRTAQLDTRIAELTKIKSPELFSPDSPIYQKANLEAQEIVKQISQIGEDLSKISGDQSLDAFKKRQKLNTDLNQLLAKRNKTLEAANKAVNDARFAYEKQTLEAQKELAEAQKSRVAQQLQNAVQAGNFSEMEALQDERVRINEQLLKAEERLLRHAGKSEELVRLRIDNERKAQLAAEQRARADELIAATKKNLRNVGTTATTGNVVEDAARAARGLNLTDAEKLDSYAASAAKITAEIGRLQQKLGDPMVEQAPLLEELEALNIQLATLEGQFDRLDTDGFEQMFRAFDPKLIAVDLQNLQSAFQNLGDTIRSEIVGAIDEIGPSLFDAIVDGEDALSVLQNIAYEMFRNIGREAAGSLVNSLSQQLLAQFESQDTRDLFGSIFGLAGENIEAARGAAIERQPEGAGAFGGLLTESGTTTSAAVANVTGQVVNVNGGIAGAEATSGVLSRISEASETQVDIGEETLQKSEGWFSQLGTLLTDGLKGLGGFLSGLFGGGSSGGAGGGLLQTGLSLLTRLFGAAGGAEAIGTRQGAVTSSGVIAGPGTGLSDSIAAALFHRGGVEPIAVSAGESILTAKATQMIGADQIARWNKGIIRGFAEGMVPASAGSAKAAKLQIPVQAPPKVDASTKIVNVVDKDLVHDYMSSSSGERVVLNVIQKNPGAVKQYLG